MVILHCPTQEAVAGGVLVPAGDAVFQAGEGVQDFQNGFPVLPVAVGQLRAQPLAARGGAVFGGVTSFTAKRVWRTRVPAKGSGVSSLSSLLANSVGAGQAGFIRLAAARQGAVVPQAESAGQFLMRSAAEFPVAATEAQNVLNERLRQMGLPAGRWLSKGRVALSRLPGKELVLLAWAIEDADPGLIPRAIQNWKGLAPEERWWLFTMTNAATGHAITGRDRGWRKAVRFALTENPVSDDRPLRTESMFSLLNEEGRD